MEAVQNFKEAMSNPNSRKAFIERNKLNIMMYGAGATTILFVYHVLSDGDFSFLLTLGGLTRLMGFFFLLTKMVTERSCSGVSLKTLELYALIFLARLSSILFYEGYLPYDSSGDWFYQFVEIVSLILVGVLIFLSVVTYKSTYNAAEDGFGRFKSIPTQMGPFVLIIPCFLMALLLHPSLNRNVFTDVAWTFALYLETLAIVPQFYLLQKSNRPVEPWVSHFVFSVGVSRLFLLIFWASSYHELSDKHSIGITGGWVGRFVLLCQLLHLGVMADFCYYYIKASIDRSPLVLPGTQV
mmetsp:Transcript_365/g.503  ORF Transcript_365/g.503 Transcript_365/m.503 type:complete len:297 (-) Transcript_365:73-963(-)